MLTSATCVSPPWSSTICSTVKSESPYSSILGRWWPYCASSTASGWRSNSRCIASRSSRVASLSATQTNASGRFRYSLISSTEMSASLRPFSYATQLTSIRRSLRSPRAAQRLHEAHGGREPPAEELDQRAFLVELRGLEQQDVHVGDGARLVLVHGERHAL